MAAQVVLVLLFRRWLSPCQASGRVTSRPHLALAPVIFRLVSPQNAGRQNVNHGENLNGLRRTFGRPSSNVLVNPILHGFGEEENARNADQ